jgi:hypothetical protein
MNNELGRLPDSTNRLTVNPEILASDKLLGSHPRKTEQILTPEGKDVGKFIWALLYGEQDFKDFINFSADPFVNFRKKIPLREIWPMALLHDLQIPDAENRNRGFGKRAAGSFLKLAKEAGAVCAFLRVGNGHGDQLQKTLHIYRSNGWVLLDRKENECYFMYHDLNLG